MDNLLKKLVSDEKKIDRKLYSSGPYWNYKNSKAIIEINRTGLDNFRGLNSGIGTSYADNLAFFITLESLNDLPLYLLDIIYVIFFGSGIPTLL